MTTNKNWSSLKTYFVTDHSESKSVQRNNMDITGFRQSNYMAFQVLQEVQNVQHLVSQAHDSISSNHIYQDNVPPPASLVYPVANETICANYNVK